MDIEEMYKSGMSIPEINKETGVPLSTIRFKLKKLGILRSRKDGVIIAASKGKLSHSKGKKRTFTDEWKNNISKSKMGKGLGISKKPRGYIEITMGEHKGRLEHIVIMERLIGRRLMANECVHHIDKVKHNNSPDNLQLMTRSEHASHHAKENNPNRIRCKHGRYTNGAR